MSRLGAPRFMHVGYPRTGSTLLQTVVFPRLFPLLEQQGISCESDEGLVGDFDFDKLYIPTALRRVSTATKVLVVVRRQADMIPSLYSNYIKSGGREPFVVFLARQIQNRRFFYFDMVSEFFEALGREQVMVQLHEELWQNPVQSIKEIARFAGLESEFAWSETPSRHNSRPMHYDTEARRLINILFRRPYRGIPHLANGPGRSVSDFAHAALSGALKLSSAGVGRPRDISRQDAIRRFIAENYEEQNRLLGEILDVDLQRYGYHP